MCLLPSLCLAIIYLYEFVVPAGKWEGVHAFAVRIRDDNLQVAPGVRIRVSICA
jgi:hypothetical protein